MITGLGASFCVGHLSALSIWATFKLAPATDHGKQSALSTKSYSTNALHWLLIDCFSTSAMTQYMLE